MPTSTEATPAVRQGIRWRKPLAPASARILWEGRGAAAEQVVRIMNHPAEDVARAVCALPPSVLGPLCDFYRRTDLICAETNTIIQKVLVHPTWPEQRRNAYVAALVEHFEAVRALEGRWTARAISAVFGVLAVESDLGVVLDSARRELVLRVHCRPSGGADGSGARREIIRMDGVHHALPSGPSRALVEAAIRSEADAELILAVLTSGATDERAVAALDGQIAAALCAGIL